MQRFGGGLHLTVSLILTPDMKKLLFTIAALLTLSVALQAQEHTYRDQGYKGNLSYTNTLLVWNGLDTSHGYMFDEHHYLGGGAGLYFAVSVQNPPVLVRVFADYHAYWFKRKSTPLAGIIIAYTHSVYPVNMSEQWMEFEPTIGWSWGLNSGYGLTLSLGAKIATTPVQFTENRSFPFSVLPTLTFAFEF